MDSPATPGLHACLAVALVATVSGSYAVRGVDGSGCTWTSAQVMVEGARLSFEERIEASAYSLQPDAIGSWYAPNAAAGSACFVATTPAGAGRVEATPALAPNAWVVVTASTPCAEGSAGGDLFGIPRMSLGTWAPCGP